MSAPSWIVVKFGGTSVASQERWNNIKSIIEQHVNNGSRVLIVCSAAAKVSNLLIKAINTASEQKHVDYFNQIHAIYTQLREQLTLKANVIETSLQQLQQLLQGIALLGDASDKVRAKIMAYGELLSTQLGHAFLQQQGLSNHWMDARQWLKAQANPSYLMGHCEDIIDPDLQQQWQQLEHPILITQGYISGDEHGDTVLLGRGGSDSSAAFFAAKLGAERLEIWTDVPGMYTANP